MIGDPIKETILIVIVILAAVINGLLVLIGSLADGIDPNRSIPLAVITWVALVILAIKGANS